MTGPEIATMVTVIYTVTIVVTIAGHAVYTLFMDRERR